MSHTLKRIRNQLRASLAEVERGNRTDVTVGLSVEELRALVALLELISGKP